MRGNPLSRAVSADGRWAYTLYDGGGTHPFIHALDTAHATARCIDVRGLAPTILSRLRLRMGDGGRVVQITDGAETLATLDTHTLTVSRAVGWAFVAAACARRGRGPARRRRGRAGPASAPPPGADAGSGRDLAVVDAAAPALRLAAPLLLVEPALLRRLRRLRRPARPLHLRRLAELLEDPLGRELSVPEL